MRPLITRYFSDEAARISSADCTVAEGNPIPRRSARRSPAPTPVSFPDETANNDRTSELKRLISASGAARQEDCTVGQRKGFAVPVEDLRRIAETKD